MSLFIKNIFSTFFVLKNGKTKILGILGASGTGKWCKIWFPKVHRKITWRGF